MIETRYNPSDGLMVISSEGIQRYTKALDSSSAIFTDIFTDKSNRHIIDSAWETGNIYYIEGSYVKKVSYDGTSLASLSMSNPWGLSVVQFGTSMSSLTINPNEEVGCWVSDKGYENLLKLDSNLNVVAQFEGVKDPSSICSASDGGCFVTDDSSNNIIKISSDGAIEGIKPYGTVFDEIVQIVSDAKGGVWIAGRYNDSERIIRLYLSGGVLEESFSAIDPLGNNDLSSSSSAFEEYRLGSIDTDRGSGDYQYAYVTIGNGHSSYIQKYDISGNKIAENEMSFIYPYLVKVVQGVDSTSLYVLVDPTKWDDFGHGSSSSSSSVEFSSSSSSSS